MGSFKEILYDFVREGGGRSSKGVDEGLVGEVDVQITDVRFGVGLP